MGRWTILLAVFVSAMLTWVEWVWHRPPEIALIAIIHFVIVLVVFALAVRARRWFAR